MDRFYVHEYFERIKLIKIRELLLIPGPEVIKLFSCSTQLRIKFQLLINIKNIKKFSIFWAQISLECYFSCSQMFTIVGILTFMSRNNFMFN